MGTKMGIYRILNKITNKFYIGSAINIKNRWNKHILDLRNNKHHNIYLQRAWIKYGEDNFHFEIIEIVDKNFLIEREQYYLDLFKSYDKNIGYNINPIANSQQGRLITEEYRAKARIRFGGKNNPMYGKYGKDNPNFGSKRTEDTIKKMSKSQSGKNNPMYGKYGKDNPNSKKIIQLTLDNEFVKNWDCLSDIKRELKLNIGNIILCCQNKIKYSKGFKWKYGE